MLDTGDEHQRRGSLLEDSEPGEDARIRNRIVPLVIAGTFFMQMLDTSILNTSLPQMARTFGVQPLDMSIGVTVYMLVFAAMLPLSGWLSERFGARLVFQSSVVVFTCSSLACGLSGDLGSFVAARAVQGLGASMMTPVGRVIILRTVSKQAFLQAMATVAVPALAAPLVGPLLGGALTTFASWRWNFLVNIPIGFLSSVLIARWVPRFAPQPGRVFDLKGFLLSSTSLAALLQGVESMAHGDSRKWTWVALAWGLSGGAWALGHLRRTPHPLVDLQPLSYPTFRLSTLAAGTWIRVAISSTPFLLPLLFQVGLGFSPIVSGGYLAAYFAGNLAMKSVTTAALRRFGFRFVVIGNGILVGLSLLSMTAIGRHTPFVLVGALLFFAGLVRSLEFTSLGSLVFADIPQHLSSSASTLSSMSQQIAMAMGVTLVAACLNASKFLAGHGSLEPSDFRVALAGAASLAFLASWLFRALAPDAGAELTGRSEETGGHIEDPI